MSFKLNRVFKPLRSIVCNSKIVVSGKSYLDTPFALVSIRYYHRCSLLEQKEETKKNETVSSMTDIPQIETSTGFSKLMSYFGFRVAPLTYSTSKALLDNCIVASKNRIWYSHKRGKIGNDFRSQHTLLLIHIWMIHKRLLKEGEKGQDIQVNPF